LTNLPSGPRRWPALGIENGLVTSKRLAR
jgi:hypothetical protein